MLAKLSDYYVPSMVARFNRTGETDISWSRNDIVGSVLSDWNAPGLTHALHQKYGPVVRIGANELSFADLDSIKDIYGQSSQPCLKLASFYDAFSVTGAANIFTESDRKAHSFQRRMLSHGFSANAIMESEDIITEKISSFLDTIGAKCAGGASVDIYHYLNCLYLDIVSQLSFDQSFDSLKGNMSSEEQALHAWENIVVIRSMFPWLSRLPFPMIRKGHQGRKTLSQYSKRCIDAFKEKAQARTHASEDKKGLLYGMVVTVDGETGEKLSDLQLRENSLIFITAGSGTSSTT